MALLCLPAAAMLFVCAFFALMFGAVLLLELEEAFGHLQSWVRARCAAAFPKLARRRRERRLAKATKEPVAATAARVEIDAAASQIEGVYKQSAGSKIIVNEPPVQFTVQEDLAPEQHTGSDGECEPSEEMLHHANTVTAAHALRFPRASLSIHVQPPPPSVADDDDDDDVRGRHRLRAKTRKADRERRELLRVHEGYMFIEDRLLRFKFAGGRDKTYEVWHASRWREAKRQEIWIRNDEDEMECVALICVLEGPDCWTPLRVRGSGWIECS